VTWARLRYYAASIPTLVAGVRNWPATALGLLRAPRGGAFVVELRNGCRFKVATALDLWILKEVCLDREYERHGPTIRNGWAVVDVGAGLGEFCIQVAREHPGCRVYAFEPGPESFALLRENVRLNAVRNVSLFPSAVGGRAGVSVLRRAPGAPARASTVAAAGAGPGAPVPTTTLGDILRDLDIPRCDFLKIDCEGAEYDILMGADADTLQRVTHMSVEYHDGVTAFSGAELAAWLERQGFRVRRVPNPAYPRTLGWLYATNPRPTPGD
jgi:FkbM family methyltransferase